MIRRKNHLAHEPFLKLLRGNGHSVQLLMYFVANFANVLSLFFFALLCILNECHRSNLHDKG